MCIKGFVCCLSHDHHLDRFDRDPYCRSSYGDNVDLLSTTMCTTAVVGD